MPEKKQTIQEFESGTEAKIQELKRRFKDVMIPELYENKYLFYRFLKSLNYDLSKTEALLKKHLKWREEYQIDTILNDTVVPKELEKYFTQCFLGFDKEHATLKYFAYGNMDLKGWWMSAKLYDRLRYFFKMTEEEVDILDRESEKFGEYLKGVTHIVDMKNFSFATATDKKIISDTILMGNMYQENYPERLKRIIVINASSYFTIAFSVIKTFIAASIIQKVQVYGPPEDWKPVLLKYVDADVLPAFLGGTRTDPDGNPLCHSFVNHGSVIPNKFYIHKSKNSISKSKEAKKLVLPRAAYSEIELVVKEAGSVIEWEFETKSRDIGFGLFLKELESDDEEKITELVPLLRLETEDFSETGMYRCEKAGTYIMLFDNSYSWMRSKEIYYKASVVSPKEHENEMMS